MRSGDRRAIHEAAQLSIVYLRIIILPSDHLSHWMAAIADARSVSALEVIVIELARTAGFSDGAYYRLTRLGSPVSPTFVFGAGFEAWLRRYVERGYALTDPVVPWAFRRDRPFTSLEVAAEAPGAC